MKPIIILSLYVIICSLTIQADTISDVVAGYTKLATAAVKKKNYTHAISYYHTALKIDPNNLNLHAALSAALKELGQFEEAIKHLQHAIAIDPNNLNNQLSLANMLTLAEQPEAALPHYQKVLLHHPDIPEILYNYGFALKKSGFIHQALAVYERVLTLNPDYQHAHFSRALAYLSLGDFTRGWQGYEWRQTTTKSQDAFFAQQTRWDGSQDLNGKTIALVAEQGLGDTFQFIRYAQLLKTTYPRCAIICQVQPALTSILRACPYIDTLISHKDKLNTYNFDYYSLLLSLPLYFSTVEATIPASIPYIWADSKLVAQWKKELSSDTNFKIGICWQGNTQYVSTELQRTVAAKSVTPQHFTPLSRLQGISMYSLQKIDNSYSADSVPFALHFFADDFDQTNGRFADTAAVMQNLDLVITVDTSVAHCAGALGVPVWLVLPYPADWRWMLERTDTPWYPNMRLFRQEKRGDWESVFAQVVLALSKLLIDRNTQTE